MSDFAHWFTRQYGKRVGNRPFHDLTDERLEMIIREGDIARRELESRRLWDARETAALYAWQARPVPDECPQRSGSGEGTAL